MLRIYTYFAGSALLLLLGACAAGGAPGQGDEPAAEGGGEDDGVPPTAEPMSTSFVRFELGTAPMALGDVPFPSDLYRDADGRIAIGAIPNPRSDATVFEATRALLAARDGFCTTCNAVFAVEGELSVEALPAAGAPPSWEDAIVIVDVEPTSPEHGRLFGVRWQWDAEQAVLTVRPARGETLAGGRRYAIAITDAAEGGDGLPLAPAPAFASVRDGAPAGPEGPEGSAPSLVEAAAAVLAPTLAELEGLGLPRDRVRALAAFRTEDPTADLRAIRAVIAEHPVPILAVDAVWEGEALDVLLGVPEVSGPGIDLSPTSGTEGTAAIAHETVEIVVAGRFAAPRFVAGDGVEIGATLRDAEDRPVSAHDEEVPFLLIVPKNADLSELPVVVMHHGFNASRTTGFALADTAGRAGFAVLAIDAFQHGDRAASASDERHAMRGDFPGPDGFAETSTLDVSARTFGLSGGPDDMTLFPGYALGAFEQFAADAMSAIALVRQEELQALQAADPRLAELAFDAECIAYVGNSMGAVVGVSVVTAEPNVRAAVLDVLPGSIIETLAESGEFRPLTESILLPQVGVTTEFDEVERAMLFDPTVDLYRWVLEPVDPLALARAMVSERVAGPAPDLLIQLAGHDEVAAPTASESVVAAARIGGAGEFAFAPIAPIDLPVIGRPATPAIAAVGFPGAMHGMLEVASQPSHFEAPLQPPLMPREPPVTLHNPIAPVHAQIETFLSTHRVDGHAVIDG